jgi:hypothetical protein
VERAHQSTSSRRPKVSDRLTLTRRVYAEFSTEINGQTAVFNLETRQLEDPAKDPVRFKKNNFGPRFGAAHRVTDKASSIRPRSEMADHDAFHDADFPREDASQRTLSMNVARVRAYERSRSHQLSEQPPASTRRVYR